jgi:uncharacterized protein YegL
MLKYYLVFFLLIFIKTQAQVTITPKGYDFNDIELANQIYASYIITNNSTQKIYLLKVEGDPSITYRRITKAIQPGTSDTLKVWYSPSREGNFYKEFQIYLSDDVKPFGLSMKGNLLHLDKDPTLNCYSFSKTEAGVNIILADVEIYLIDSITKKPINNGNVTQFYNNNPRFTMQTNEKGYVSLSLKPNLYQYQFSATGYNTIKAETYINRKTKKLVYELSPINQEKISLDTIEIKNISQDTVLELIVNESTELPVEFYAANNIVFLIDISSSMNLSDRLPLLKESMHTLIDQLRPIDKVSIITYATQAKVIYSSKLVKDKNELLNIIDELVAGGSTSADKGLGITHEVLIDNYISGGNNQIVMATDGAFELKEKDLALFNNGTAEIDKQVNFSILGFGKSKDARKALKKIADKFRGSFIYISSSDDAEKALLNEIKRNSLKH